eukprot:3968176-Amphidinium_carterae.2
MGFGSLPAASGSPKEVQCLDSLREQTALRSGASWLRRLGPAALAAFVGLWKGTRPRNVH